jgi:hypothetical protein
MKAKKKFASEQQHREIKKEEARFSSDQWGTNPRVCGGA